MEISSYKRAPAFFTFVLLTTRHCRRQNYTTCENATGPAAIHRQSQTNTNAKKSSAMRIEQPILLLLALGILGTTFAVDAQDLRKAHDADELPIGVKTSMPDAATMIRRGLNVEITNGKKEADVSNEDLQRDRRNAVDGQSLVSSPIGSPVTSPIATLDSAPVTMAPTMETSPPAEPPVTAPVASPIATLDSAPDTMAPTMETSPPVEPPVTARQDSITTFCVVADAPYNSQQAKELQRQIVSMDTECEFVVHLGDIRDAANYDDCMEGSYSDASSIMSQSEKPVIMLIGGKIHKRTNE